MVGSSECEYSRATAVLAHSVSEAAVPDRSAVNVMALLLSLCNENAANTDKMPAADAPLLDAPLLDAIGMMGDAIAEAVLAVAGAAGRVGDAAAIVGDRRAVSRSCMAAAREIMLTCRCTPTTG
jgi:hypothetical protein